MSDPHLFRHLAGRAAHLAGTWQAFVAAAALIVAWAISGFWFGFTNPLYQLVINTATTIVTFLMVFLLQSSQNHDTAAMQVKLDMLIAATERASNAAIGAERLEEAEVARLREMIAERTQ